MNKQSVFVLFTAMVLMASPLALTTPEAGAENWTVTTDPDFEEGESFFVESSSGTLQLARSVSGLWSARGEEASDEFGYSVTSAGDVNGDGYDDVIVGAYLNDGAASNAGEAYVYYGSSSGLSATVAWSDQGEAGSDYFGSSVAAAGDVNGDGYDDVIVGAKFNGASNNGEAYVYHGSASGLSATPDWSDQGETSSDYFGISVASAGDVNGDGYDDVVVGATGNDGGGSSAGEAYLYHGSSSGLSLSPDWYDQGELANDEFSHSLASAGDVNGDGYDDVIIGAFGNDGAGSAAGEAYVYHGSSSGLTQDAAPNWYDQGAAANDNFGKSVSGAGDVNGDGYADVIVGAHANDDGGSDTGKAYIYFGSSSGLTQDADPNWSDHGEAINDYFGRSVASAGDVNGDGYDDVMVGANGNDDGGSSAGEAYLYHGSSSGLSSNPVWSDRGEAASDYFGSCVAGAGDVNGDGYDDVIVGAYGNDLSGSNAGRAYVYSYGLDLVSLTEPLSTGLAEASNDNFGFSVARAGDVNGDGFSDIIVGAYYNDGGGPNAGEVYVYHGSFTGFSTTPDWSDQGEADYDYFGFSVAGAGDVNGDGYDDVIVGAYENDDGGSSSGEAYVYFGSSSGLSSSPDWSDQGEVAGNDFGYSVAGVGNVNGDNYDDIIVGARYNSDGGSSAGEIYVYYGSSSGPSSTPDWSVRGEAAGVYLGHCVASAGDVNGDGYDDVLAGTPLNDGAGSDAGEAMIYHGSSSGPSSTPDWSDEGEAYSNHFGHSVAGAGDVNNDGYDDVIIAAHENDDKGYDTGKVYVYYGSSSGSSATPDWSVMGEASYDEFGQSVAGAGDVNGDGYDDVIIGSARHGDDGKAYVYHGQPSGLTTTPDWSEEGEADGSWFGYCVAGAGDVNGDGYDNVVIGDHLCKIGGSGSGKVYIYGLAYKYITTGIYESKALEIGASSNHPNWHSISWNPDAQPDGTRVRAQVASSNDSVPANWRGPDGTSSSYYTASGEQTIFSGEQGKFLRVRVYLETGLGTKEMLSSTPTLTDFTVSYGSFTKPTVEINWPNGGENLMHGESYPVTWTTTGDLTTTDPIALSYSLDGGSTWTSITTGTDNDGLHVWTLPSNQDVERAMVKVVAIAPDGSFWEDTNDRPFSIDPPPVSPGSGNKVHSPAAAENLVAGSSMNVQWELTGEETVSLHYSTDFGQNWVPLARDILNLGSYHWKLPDTLTSEHVIIKVQGAEQEVVSELFSISEEDLGALEKSDSSESSGSPEILNGLLALVIMVLVALALVVRHGEDRKRRTRQSRPQPAESQEVEK